MIIHCADGRREWIPKGATLLDADMHITTVIAPEVSGN
jgi:hypothetical protein